MAIIYAMISMILFITNLIIKFYNAFAIHKAIRKQASITKILLTRIFGIFSQTITQLVAQIQVENLHDHSDDNNSHYGNLNNKTRKSRPNFRGHSAEVTTSNHNNNEILTEMYVDTNYKLYNTTIRRTESGLQLRTLEPTKKIQKPPLPERKYKPEPFKLEPLETIKENKPPSILPQLITPPPAYQCIGSNLSAPIPSAPKVEQHNNLFHNHPYETPIPIHQPKPYEIDFEQLKLTANKMHNRSHSLDVLQNDQPHTNEVTYFDTHSNQI